MPSSSSSSSKPFDSTYRTHWKPPDAPGSVQPLRFSARLRAKDAKAGKWKRIRAQAPAPVRVSARILEKQASKEAVHQGKEAVQQGNKARASDDESGRRKEVQARARARDVDDDSGDESAQELLQLPVRAAVPRGTRSCISISGGSGSCELQWGSKEPRTVTKRRRLPVEPVAMENLTYKKRKAKLPVKRKAKDTTKDALHDAAAAPVAVDASLPPPPAATAAAASQAPLLASDASAAAGAGAMQLYEQFRWIGHDDGFTPPGSPSGAHHFYAAVEEQQQPSELHPPPGKRMCPGLLSRSGIRDGRSRDAHRHKEQQEVLLLQKHLQQQQQELQLQLTAGGDGDAQEDAVRGYDELQPAVRVLPRPDGYDLDQQECWSPPWRSTPRRSTPSNSDAFMHALHHSDFGSAARAQLPQLRYADGSGCSTQTSSLATVDHAIAQRRPVRRSIRFEQVLETAFDNNPGLQQDQQLHHINGSPPEDLSCSIAPVTPQKSSQALRTPSPASPSSPPSPLLLGPCHSVTNPHDQEQQQQQQQGEQGDGFCGGASPGQEGRHCLPDLNCPPDQTSTPTPQSKPRRKKYTPKVQKEKKRSVSNKPAPKPRKPRAQPPEGGQVRRAGARKSKQKQVEESQDHEQQQPLPGQEPGVMNDPDVPGPVMEFAQEGDKRRNQRGASRRRTVDDWPNIVSRAQDVQDAAAAAQVGSSTYPSCAQPQSVDLASFTDRTRASQTTITLLWGNGTHHDLQQQAAPQLVGTPVPQLPYTSWPCSSPDDDDCTMEQQQQQRSSGEELALATHHRVQPLCSLPIELHQTPQMQQRLLLEASGCTDDDNRLALVPHPGTTKDMILYQEPVKKKKSRPKVVLDEATLRCWNLLMGKRQPEAIDEDGTSSLKWEEERKAMKRRVSRFLDRTHQVQGDHTFCIWKGSVVDSVVGAFLTQNVSDQLSSSAFMAMAARFPVGRRDGEGKGKGSDSNNDTGKDQVQASSTPHAQPVIGQQTGSESGQPLSPQEVSQTRPPHDVNSLPNCTIQESSSMSAVESGFIRSPGCGCFAKPGATSHGDDCKRHLFPQVTNEYGKSLAGGHPKALTGITLKVCLEVELPSSDSQGFSSTLQGTPATVSSSQLEAESRIATQQLVLGTYGCGDGHTQDARGESTSSGTQWETTNTTTSLVSVGENAECCGVAGATTVMEQDREICNYADAHPLPIATAPSCASAIENSTAECGPALLEDAKKGKPRKGHSHLGGLERAHIEAKQGGNKSKTDWEALRKEILAQEADKGEQRGPAMDAANWEAVRHADLKDIANVIKERGMNYMLAGRISAFLERLHKEHESIDLEWLRGLSPDSAKNFLLSIRGLGLKSVECIRLLTLHHRAFPVDTNVGRICVRLGWVPLEPLPEELQLHLLELYPVQATIQQYLWPRLCTLDQTTLYELHYQMITFGKVFCTKSKPNCFHCPMQKDCRHYASSSRAKLLLPGPEADADKVVTETPQLEWSGVQVPAPDSSGSQLASEGAPRDDARRCQACEPIVDMPSSPEPPAPALDADPYLDYDIEDCCDYRPCMSDGRMIESTNKQLLPLTIEESISEVLEQMEGLVLHSRNFIRQSMCHGEEGTEVSALRAFSTDDSTCTSTTSPDHPEETVSDITDQFDLRSSVVPEPVSEEDEYLRFRRELLSASSRELVLIPPEIACRPPTQLKRYGRLRTVHNVYEIPDNHPILRKVEPRDALDPYMYLLAIWGPGEGIQSPAGSSESTSSGCIGKESETVKGTLLIPCRTALRGIFPLNGTYFQKNEVFADHESSTEPLIVSRHLLWNLRRRLVYFGTTATNIYRNLTMEEIQACGWAACVCVRGFERGTRAPKPLAGRLHYPASKLQAQKEQQKKIPNQHFSYSSPKAQ